MGQYDGTVRWDSIIMMGQYDHDGTVRWDSMMEQYDGTV